MNTRLLVSDAHHFRVDYEINPYMHVGDQPDPEAAVREHDDIVAAHHAAGRRVERMPSAPECPDMVFTANTAVVRRGRAVLGTPPPERKAEIPYVQDWLVAHGYDVLETPWAFSGQGDALTLGDLLLVAHGQRTDPRVLPFLEAELECEVVPMQTSGPRWYDLDLAVGVVDDNTLAFCAAALDPPSRRRLGYLGADLIEVSEAEASGFALNLVSDGRVVTMTTGAPRFAAELRERGLEVVELDTSELAKGGGGVRCTALTLGDPPS